MLIAARFALYLVLMLAFGLPLFSLYATCRADRGAGSQLALPIVVAIISLVGAALSVLGLLLMAAAMSDVPLFQLDHATVDALLNQTATGTAGKVRVIALSAGLPAVGLLRKYPRLLRAALSGLGAVALGSLAWTGHGAADEGGRGLLHLTADIGHLLAAGLWVGALAGLMMLLSRAWQPGADQTVRIGHAHHALASFSTVGTGAVLLIVLTGVINSWLLVGIANIASLPSSLYGQLLILKLLIFAAMLGLAGLNRFRFTPAMEASLHRKEAAAGLKAISLSVALESSFALIILALVAWLGTLAPPAAS